MRATYRVRTRPKPKPRSASSRWSKNRTLIGPDHETPIPKRAIPIKKPAVDRTLGSVITAISETLTLVAIATYRECRSDT